MRQSAKRKSCEETEKERTEPNLAKKLRGKKSTQHSYKERRSLFPNAPSLSFPLLLLN